MNLETLPPGNDGPNWPMGHAKHAKPLWNSIPIENSDRHLLSNSLSVVVKLRFWVPKNKWKQRCGRKFLDDQWKHVWGLGPLLMIKSQHHHLHPWWEGECWKRSGSGWWQFQSTNSKQTKIVKKTVHMIVEHAELTSYHLGDSQYNCLRIPTRISLKTKCRTLAPSRICCLPFFGRNPTLEAMDPDSCRSFPRWYEGFATDSEPAKKPMKC